MRRISQQDVSKCHERRGGKTTYNSLGEMLPVDKGVDLGHVRLSATMQRDLVHEMDVVAAATVHLVLNLAEGLAVLPVAGLPEAHA